MSEISQLSDAYRKNIHRAVKILKSAGCSDVYLFGSLATGELEGDSDIDLAVRGCPKGEFFHLLGQLLLELDCPVDLISLDSRDLFAHYLEREGKLIQVG